jgi:GTP cyclohydrolase I
MEQAYASLITAIGEDLNRAGLADTPKRAAKAFQYLCKGYDEDLELSSIMPFSRLTTTKW